MTVTVNKSNISAVVTIGAGLGIAKANLYAVISPGIQITKANSYAVLQEMPPNDYIKVGRVFPFTLGRTIWAIPLYVKPKGF
jgi:hypothetical protein